MKAVAGQGVEAARVRHPRYLVLALLVLAVEVVIALFVRDRVVRPFVGDVLVIVLIYAVLRAFLATPPRRLALAVLLFSFGVETLQYFDYVALLGLQDHRILSVMMGRTFSPSDFLAYLSGYALLLAGEHFRKPG